MFMKINVSIALALSCLISLVTNAAALATTGAVVPMDRSKSAVHTTPIKIDAAADQLIHKMAIFYSGLTSFSATIASDMHVEAKSESYKNDSQSLFEVKMQRPNKVSFVMKSGRMGGEAKSDGHHLNFFASQLGDKGTYMSVDAPSGMGAMFAKPEFAFISGGMTGLALVEALLSSDPYGALMPGVTSVTIVGKETVNGVPTQHLHLAQNDLFWDIWIDSGKQPWVRKIVPDVSSILAHYEGASKDVAMKLAITYKNVAANPILGDADFKFTAPAQAKLAKSFFGSEEEAQDGAKALLRKPAPPIQLDTVDGGKFDLAALKGKNIVVIDFWATWCPPCKESLPLLAEITEEYKKKGIVFCAVNVKEDAVKVKSFLAAQNLKINVALDKNGDVAKAYGVMGIPQTLVIDPDGVIRDVRLGFDEDIKEKMADQFDIIFAGLAAQRENK
jgi:peroxiredoxin